MKPKNPLFFLLRKIKLPLLLILFAITISSVGSISGLFIPLFTGKVVDKFSENTFNLGFIALFLCMFLINAVLSGIGLYLLSKIGEKMIMAIRYMLWEHIIKLKIPFFDNNESGSIMSRITEDTNVINAFVSQKLPNIIPSIITVLGSIIILLRMDWQMTLITLIIVPIFLAIIIPLGGMVRKISKAAQSEAASFSGLLGRVLTEIRLVKISNTESLELKNAHSNLFEIYKLGLKEAKIISIIQPLTSFILLLTIGIILGFGGIRVSTGAISAGTLVAMIFYVIQLSGPLTNFSTLLTDYQRAIGASQRLSEILLEHKEELDSNRHVSNIDFSNRNLKFSSVSFKFDDKQILNKITFDIPSRKVTAFVGPSGSGKSTIFNLIARLYELPLSNGSISLGGIPINEFNLSDWRNKIGYVMQTNAMINGTIKDNIVYGIKKEISEEEIIKYSQLSNCHEFVTLLDKGYDTIIGEKGLKLSGGQRQRIDIARNFIKDPDILLLDEATASLDSESERKIQDSLEELMKKRTTVIIAHRLATIKKADQIIFLDQGVITGKGTHDQLMRNHDKYRRFVSAQKLVD
ncbi:ABC transporter ATP-binding protein/permease [Bacillus pumilus]|uniref:ABC transporter ATP-binding protein n=1 Tax=Bacillus TaxID=1386 RepID=UPI000D034643|nr:MULTISPECIES: ABC transporter ATP-binding protein [Bacillus]MBU5257992.1 ABC transporter ATP-binding protein/permease [Bacillus pumilus]PRS58263.1 ABC transporter ATP-binding protein [Bacillus sp. GBSW19]PRS68315.1 ABC transporter ATP-binding protein [Bacillus sp. NMTD17]